MLHTTTHTLTKMTRWSTCQWIPISAPTTFWPIWRNVSTQWARASVYDRGIYVRRAWLSWSHANWAQSRKSRPFLDHCYLNWVVWREKHQTIQWIRKLLALSSTQGIDYNLKKSLIILTNSSGYDSSPPVKQFTPVYKQQQEKPTTAYATSAYASEEESEMVPPPPPRKLPAGAVAMPHMMAL